MKRVFFFTYYFPPLGGVASIRNTKFALYLPQFGWEPVVFHGGAGSTFPNDASLRKDVGAVETHEVRSFELAGLHGLFSRLHLGRVNMELARVFPIDQQIGWVPGLVLAASRTLRKQGRPDAVFTSSAPFSVNLAGSYMRRHFGLPWVSDLQDEWTTNPAIRYLTPAHRALAQRFEGDLLATADAITVCNDGHADEVRAAQPPHAGQVSVIRDGFDDADFPLPAPEKPGDKFTIASVGTAYKSIDPLPILEALEAEIAAGEIEADRVRVVHAGRGRLDWPAGLRCELQTLGFVSHSQAIDLMRRAHLLIILRRHDGASSGRIYEYMRAETDILAVAGRGSVLEHLINDSGCGISIPFEETERVRVELRARYRKWRDNAGRLPPRAVPAAIQRYSRREQARQLADVLDTAVATAKAGTA